MKRYVKLSFITIIVISTVGIWLSVKDQPVRVYTYKVINAFDHDPNAFTQGLVYDSNFLYEGTGLYGASTIRKIELKTGKILQQKQMDPDIFGEGITIFKDRIFQLTYTQGVAFAYDKKSFELLKTFNYYNEGWGITHDGKHIITSDGTATLHFLNPETLKETRRITVHDGDSKIWDLNELEYINGVIYANVWYTNWIIQIDPKSGKVKGWIDLAGLCPPETARDKDAVPNGIAYDRKGKRLFVTGKLWPKLYEIKLIRKR